MMVRGLVLLSLLGLTLAYPNGFFPFAKYRRDEPVADEALADDVKEFFDCQEMNEKCYGAGCCSGLVCDNDGLVGEGVCVDCLPEGDHCELDRQCCNSHVCMKSFGSLTGECGTRVEGSPCWRDAQCPGDLECVKGRFKFNGVCGRED